MGKQGTILNFNYISKIIQFYPLFFIYIHVNPLLSSFIRLHPYLFIFIHLYWSLSIDVSFYPYVCISIRLCPLSSTAIYFWPYNLSPIIHSGHIFQTLAGFFICNVYKQANIFVYKKVFLQEIMSDGSSLTSDGEIDIQPLITKLGKLVSCKLRVKS
jgi:hypothetical protein